MSETEIRKLLRKIKEQNSQSAFREFYDLCYDRFFRIAYYYLKNEAFAQEVVLDVFVKLWEKRDTLLAINNIEDYCFIMVKNMSLNFLEKESRHISADTERIPEFDSQSDSPEDTFITEELFAIYVKALDRLPDRCREVFIRAREEKQSYAQIADEMGISTKTVDAQLQKALLRLKEIIRNALEQ